MLRRTQRGGSIAPKSARWPGLLRVTSPSPFEFSRGRPYVQALLRSPMTGKETTSKTQSLPPFLDTCISRAGWRQIPCSPRTSDVRLRAAPGAVQLITTTEPGSFEFSYLWATAGPSARLPKGQVRESLLNFRVSFPPPTPSPVGETKSQQQERAASVLGRLTPPALVWRSGASGTAADSTPPCFLRPLLQHKPLAGVLEKREVSPRGGAGPLANCLLRPSAHVLMPPPSKPLILAERQCPKVISTCPLSSNGNATGSSPPGETAAALQYGTACITFVKELLRPRPGAGDERRRGGGRLPSRAEFAKSASTILSAPAL